MGSHTLIWALTAYGLAMVTFAGVVNAIGNDNPHTRATVVMGVGTVYLWVVVFGWLSYRFRDRFRCLFVNLPGPWQAKFVVFTTGFALLEETITVTFTNLAPLLGSEIGKAYITASTNYFHVVGLFSVFPLVFPWILVYAALLSRVAFPPNHVLLLFGLLGTLAEATVHIDALFGGIWVLIYGLMIYLPAYGIPADRPAIAPRLRHYGLAIVLPLAAAAPAMAVATALREALGIVSFAQ